VIGVLHPCNAARSGHKPVNKTTGVCHAKTHMLRKCYYEVIFGGVLIDKIEKGSINFIGSLH